MLRRLLARATILETAMFDKNGGVLAFGGKFLVHGLRDKSPEPLRQPAALFDVVPFARLCPQPFGREAAGGRQHVAVVIALIALPAGLVDGEVGGDAVRVGQVPGNRPRHLQTARLGQFDGKREHEFAGEGGVALQLPGVLARARRSAPASRPRSRGSSGRPPMTARPWGG